MRSLRESDEAAQLRQLLTVSTTNADRLASELAMVDAEVEQSRAEATDLAAAAAAGAETACAPPPALPHINRRGLKPTFDTLLKTSA